MRGWQQKTALAYALPSYDRATGVSLLDRERPCSGDRAVGRSESDCADWRAVHDRNGTGATGQRDRALCANIPYSIGQSSYWKAVSTAGCAGLRPYRPEERVYELGVHLRPKFWGQGLATEAGHAVIARGFDDLRGEALFAGRNPANHLSERFLLKLGFVYTHDESYPPTGLMHPSYILRKATRPTGA
jgi:Acetyltransferase (GNAT) domain